MKSLTPVRIRFHQARSKPSTLEIKSSKTSLCVMLSSATGLTRARRRKSRVCGETCEKENEKKSIKLRVKTANACVTFEEYMDFSDDMTVA